MAECAADECDPGETHEIVCGGAGEIDEVEDHLAGGHGGGAEEGGERVEGVQQEETFAHEGEDVQVCLECILHAFLRGGEGGVSRCS